MQDELIEFTGISNKIEAHDSILQVLNRRYHNGIYYADEAFEPSVDQWEGIPLVYVPKGMPHPSLKGFEEAQEEELKKIQGRIVGRATNPNLTKTGHPRLNSKLVVEDEEVKSLIREGRLSLSTGFWSKVKDSRLVGPVVPNHILLFEEDANNMPVDRGSMIMNKEESEKELMPILKTLQEIVNKLRGGDADSGKEQESKTMDNDLSEKLEIANKTIETLKGEAESFENKEKTLNAEIEKLKGEVEAFKQKEADRAYEEFKNKYVSPGLIDTDEKAAGIRKLYDENPRELLNKILDARKAASDEEGEEFSNKDKDEADSIRNELKRKAGRVN